MASTKQYLDFILEQLAPTDDVTYRAMMGEYLLYYRGKVVGGIYDDRLLVKPTNAALRLLPDAEKTLPYEGAKAMLLVSEVEDKAFLQTLLKAIVEEMLAASAKK